MTYLYNILVLVGAYLIGSIPIGSAIASLKGIYNLHERGSGNTGATNIGRVLGSGYFIIVLLLDALKAYGYLFLIHFLGVSYHIILLSAGLLLLGNCYSIFLRGKGGKGVATTLGIINFLMPYSLWVVLPIWIGALMITHTVGISSSIAALSLIMYGLLNVTMNFPQHLLAIMMGGIVLIRHKSNIKKYLSY